MNSSRNIRDIRPSSSDDRYSGVVLTNANTGNIDEAIRQAKDAKDFGPVNNARGELEGFLNVKRKIEWQGAVVAVIDKELTELDRDSLIPSDDYEVGGYKANRTLDSALADDVQ